MRQDKFSLTASQAKDLKRRLWNGDSFGEIGETFGLTLAGIQAIMYGRRHARVVWPDGSTGAMPSVRRAEIRMIRRQAAREVEGIVAERTQVLLAKHAKARRAK